jgi:hypothetical protein
MRRCSQTVVGYVPWRRCMPAGSRAIPWGVVFALALAVALPAVGQDRRGDLLTIDELLMLAASRPARVDGLWVTSEVYQEPSSFSAGHIPRITRSVLVDAATGRFYMDRGTEIDHPEYGTSTGLASIVFDGEVQSAYVPEQGLGIVSEGDSLNGLVASGLWGVMLLSDPQPDGLGIDDGSLESLLAHGVVRDELELVGDTACHVVDAYYEGTRYATLWLDVERGLLPMKRVGYGRNGNPSTTVAIDSVAYLEDEQVWLPEAWRTELLIRGETLRSHTVVDMETIVLDPPIEDEYFQLDFPPGTTVADQIAGLTYKITESGDIGEILAERIDGEWVSTAPPPVDPDDGDQQAPQPAPPIVDSIAELLERASEPPDGGRITSTAPATDDRPLTTQSRSIVVHDVPPEREPSPAMTTAPVPAAETRPPARGRGAPETQSSAGRRGWVLGAAAVVVIAAVGYLARRRSPA